MSGLWLLLQTGAVAAQVAYKFMLMRTPAQHMSACACGCHRLLAEWLHLRSLCCSSAVFFITPLSAMAGPKPNDLATCQIIDWWAVAFVAVALPLALLRHMEQGRRRQQTERHWQQQGVGQTRHSLANEVLHVFLHSIVIWHVTAQLGPLLWRTPPSP